MPETKKSEQPEPVEPDYDQGNTVDVWRREHRQSLAKKGIDFIPDDWEQQETQP